MNVLILETNLLWSERLKRGVRALGHEPCVSAALPGAMAQYDLAVVNLAELDPEAVRALRAEGVRVVGHAGHKEKDLLELGRAAGCDALATNSEITHKLAEVLARALG